MSIVCHAKKMSRVLDYTRYIILRSTFIHEYMAIVESKLDRLWFYDLLIQCGQVVLVFCYFPNKSAKAFIFSRSSSHQDCRRLHNLE